jgi:hypothetical protein
MNLRDYFAQAQDEANENFFNYGGFESDDYSFAGDDAYDGFYGDDEMSNADGMDMSDGGDSSSPTSQPYIVVIKNTNTATAYPVTILGAYNTLSYTSPNYQNTAAISITMGISGITYDQFLYQSMNKPFVVGLTYFQSSTANQVLETLTLIQQDVNGNNNQKTLVPTIDPYQQQSTIIAIKFTYKIDGFTSVVLSSLFASTTAKLYFYPAETSTIARTLTGQRAVAGYGNPNIIKSDKVVLSSKALRALRGGR